MRRSGFLLGLLLPLALLAGCGPAAFHASERFSLTGPWNNFDRVVIRTTNGTVDIAPERRDDLSVTGERRSGGRTPDEARANLSKIDIVTQPDKDDPSTLVVEVIIPEPLRHNSAGASLVVRVPQPVAVDVVTNNGSIKAAGLREAVTLRTVNGAIEASEMTARVEAASSNGRLTVRAIRGPVNAHTSNGRIIAEDIDGETQLKTSNGRIIAKDIRGNIKATTSNGRIDIQALPGDEGYVVLQTTNGTIKADLPATMRGTLDVQTSNGRPETNLGSMTMTDTRWSRHALRATVNGGGQGKIVAHTTNGAIVLNCRSLVVW